MTPLRDSRWQRLQLVALTLLLGACAAANPTPTEQPPPNIVLILADDQGFADVGVYGGALPTPNIDAIAGAGVRFSDGYVSGPACVASRCGLLTGRYQNRFHCKPLQDEPLPPSEPTLAERLQARGYSTALVGKWHLGSTPGLRPLERGFDEFFGFLRGIHLYYPQGQERDAPYYDFTLEHGGELYRGHEPVTETEYLTDAFAREAVDFIERHTDRPFFLYLSFNAVHVPLQAPPEHLEQFRYIEQPARRALAAMNSAMDEAVGQVTQSLRDNGLEENTLLIYLSDNGGSPMSNASLNDPLRGAKSDLYEGGIRIPFLMQWKGVIPAGSVYDEPVISLDIASTVLAASGGYTSLKPRLDGHNLLPYLRGEENGAPHDLLFWDYKGQSALRRGDWKLLLPAADAQPQLYNLRLDIGEASDLSSTHPDLTVEMLQALDDYATDIRGYRRVLQHRQDDN